MNQVVKDKMAREIMVVNCKKLFAEVTRETKFYDNKEANLEKNILGNYEYMIRSLAEEDIDFKQPITYAIVADDKNRVFVYKRWWESSTAWEARLHSKISFWIWGHLEREDEDMENPIRDSLIREIEEEINLKDEDISSVTPIGYINDDSNDVWKVHIWISYLVKVHNSNVALLDWELDNWEFLSIDDIENMVSSWEYDVESWSKILFEPLKNILK